MSVCAGYTFLDFFYRSNWTVKSVAQSTLEEGFNVGYMDNNEEYPAW